MKAQSSCQSTQSFHEDEPRDALGWRLLDHVENSLGVYSLPGWWGLNFSPNLTP